MKRHCQNALILSFLLFAVIDSFPSEARQLGRVRSFIDPIGDVTGWWQGRWNLFAPAVDKKNNWIEAKIYTAEEETPQHWSSPNWENYRPWQKFLRSREIEYFDRLPSPRNQPAWEPFARYLSKQWQRDHSGQSIVRIDLIAVEDLIPPPTGRDHPHSQGPLKETLSRRVFHSYIPESIRP